MQRLSGDLVVARVRRCRAVVVMVQVDAVVDGKREALGVMPPSWGWSWLRVGVTGKRFVKVNIRVRNRNATAPLLFYRAINHLAFKV